MKLYELTFDIRDGEHEYLKTQVRVFRGIGQANRYGVISEYEENTGKLASKPPAPRKREKARENAAWDFGRVYRFNGARELEFVEGSDGLYQIYLGQKFSEIPAQQKA